MLHLLIQPSCLFKDLRHNVVRVYHQTKVEHADSIIDNGLLRMNREALFFTGADPDSHHLGNEPMPLYTHKRHHTLVVCVDVRGAERDGAKFYETASNAVITFQDIALEHIMYIKDSRDRRTYYTREHPRTRRDPGNDGPSAGDRDPSCE